MSLGPFDTLVDEHDQILRGLDALDLAANLVAAGRTVAPAQLGTLVDFFQHYADACHHAKEEQVLFPALAAAGVPQAGGPIAVMLAEHDEGRAYVSRMAAAIDNASEADFVGAARDFSTLLRAHIRKENEVLFRIGRRVLPTENDAAIMTAYERCEEKAINAEEKRALVDRIGSLLAALELETENAG